MIYTNELILIQRSIPIHNQIVSFNLSQEISEFKKTKKGIHIKNIYSIEESGASLGSPQQQTRIKHSQQIKKVFDEVKSNDIVKREVNASYQENNTWQIHIFSNYLESNKYLKFTDAIWLYHSEANAIIIAHDPSSSIYH